MRVIAAILMSSDTSMLLTGRLDRSDFGERRQYVGERSFPTTAQFVFLVGRSPWTAADAIVGLPGFEES
jgi:hypothetical protein